MKSVISESQIGALVYANCTVRYTQSALPPNRIHKHNISFTSLQIRSLRLFTFSYESVHKKLYQYSSFVISLKTHNTAFSLKTKTKQLPFSCHLVSHIYHTQRVASILSDRNISIVLSHCYVQSNCKLRQSDGSFKVLEGNMVI